MSEENPYQSPLEDGSAIPGSYRKALLIMLAIVAVVALMIPALIPGHGPHYPKGKMPPQSKVAPP